MKKLDGIKPGHPVQIGRVRSGSTRPRRLLSMIVVAAVALVGAPILVGTAQAANTFVVDSVGNSPDFSPGDGICDTEPSGAPVCTLYAAIEEANATTGADTIEIKIPPLDGSVTTITLTAALPFITEALTIDGTTQTGTDCLTAVPTLKVVLAGGTVPGTILRTTSGNLTVRGLVINQGTGGSEATVRLGGNSNQLECNIIGTDPTATSTQTGVLLSNNGAAVRIEGNDSIIGGTNPGQRNIIADQTSIQVQILSGTSNNTLYRNYIGVNPSGTPISHPGVTWLQGVYVEGSGHKIGGRGLDGASQSNEFNDIANMDGDGVLVGSGVNNRVVGNHIYNNLGLGIRIADGINQDAGDPDSGPNNRQNAPVMTGALVDASGNLTITASIDSVAPNSAPNVYFDFYKTDGTNNQGKVVVGSNGFVPTPGNGQIGPFPIATSNVLIGDQIVATVTDEDGNSSQFSAPITVTPAPGSPYVVTSTGDEVDAVPGDDICLTSVATCTLRAAVQEANATAGADTINFAVAGTITTGSVLSVTGDLTIDGSTAPGANCNQWPPVPTVTVANQGLFNLFSANSVFNLKGLVLRGGSDGVSTTDFIVVSEGAGSRIECNFFGTNSTGTATSGPVAKPLYVTSGQVVGGPLPKQGNLFAAENNFMFVIDGNSNIVQNNHFGVSATGGNIAHSTTWQEGIRVIGSNNQIGSLVLGQGNEIANMFNGVTVVAGTGNRIIGNDTHNNSISGIKIDNGTNEDAGDPDAGANNKQNAPTAISASISGGFLTLGYTVDSINTNSAYPVSIEYYKTDGTNNQGRRYFYQATQPSGPGSGTVGSLSAAALALSVGDSIVATATDANGNTSQFTSPVVITAGAVGAFVVNSTADGSDVTPGNGICETATGNGVCTVRAAIQEANTHAGADTINFNIPGGGVQTISPATALPSISEAVTIDGYTQPGASANSAQPGDNSVHNIVITRELTLGGVGSSGSVIRGLVLNGAGQGLKINGGSGGNTIVGNFIGVTANGNTAAAGGIFLNGSSGNVIGGATPADRNVIVGTLSEGFNAISGSNNNRIIGNYIGTNAAGTAALATSTGIALTNGNNNEVGGVLPGEGNLISGNTYGIAAEGTPGETNLKILGNFIGTNAAGTAAIPNTINPILSGSPGGTITGLVIGNGTPAGRNVISGNSGTGITFSANVTGALIQGNYIGVAADGTTPLPNGGEGVHLGTSGPVSGTVVGSGGPSYTNSASYNVIANNGGNGVNVQNGTNNAVAGNSIFNNTGLGIRLGDGRGNDVADADTGPNNYQNTPVLTLPAGSSQISWTGDFANPGTLHVIAFYKADSLASGEGKQLFVASSSFGASGIVPDIGTLGVLAGDKIVATATDATGNTSQFSNVVTYSPISAPFVVNSTADGVDATPGDALCATSSGECTLRAAIQETNALAGADVINFNIPGTGVQTITPATALPFVTGALTIDALAGNPPASCVTWPAVLTVELNATNLVNGLEAISGSSLTVRGLVINRYRQTGVALFAGSTANKLECNFIGTDANGTQVSSTTGPRFSGIFLGASGATIGGTLPTQRNLLSGAQVSQIEIRGSNNVVFGNYIGTDKNGNGNFGAANSVSQGIWLSSGASNNQIGGVGAGESNIISNRSTVGAVVVSDNTSVGNRIRGNSIFGNGGLGIDLGTPGGADIGVTYNHPSATVIPGPNNFQNFPVLTSAWITGTSLSVSGTLEGIPNETFAIDLYSNSCDPSGFGEGARPIGSFNATTSATGQATFTQTLTVSNLFEPMGISATATRTAAIGDTSEFSYCRPVSTTNTTWATAQLAPAGATQFISDRNQEKWFKFPVSPGAKVTVKLSGPAGSAISIHRDPLPIYNGLNNPTSAVALSAQAADYAFLPSGSLPSGSLPSGSLPSGSLPSGSLPSGSLEKGFLPSGSLPSGSLPSGSLPSGSLPSGSLPSGSLPSGSLPSGSLPSGSLPSGSLPSGSLPSGSLPSGSLPSGSLPSGSLPSGSLPSGSLVDAYGAAARQSVLGVSQDPFATQQTIERNTFDLNENLYVRVVGPFTGSPFTVTVNVAGGVCAAIQPITGPLPTFQNSNKATVILTDLNRIPGNAAEKQTALDALNRLAQRSDVNGVVVDLSNGYQRVSSARNQADSVKACPLGQNLVAKEIKAVVDSYRSPALKYVVLAGSADVIPYYQVQDTAGLANERDYVPPVDPNSASEAGLRSGLIGGQDFYGSSADLTVGSRTVSVPGLAVGRLVDTAADIANAVATYEATNGVVTPRSSLVSGYDFVGDGAQAVATDLAAATTGPNAGVVQETLIQPQGEAPTGPNAWTGPQLRSKLLAGGHDVIAISGHFSAGNLLAADYASKLSASELIPLTNELRNTIVIALGCHGGYSVPTPDLLSGSSPDPDWAKAFLRKGSAGFVAATGYAYGDTIFTEYGERLVVDFTKQMRTGTGPISLGEALVKAKQNYLANTPELAGIDEKTVIIMALFGLPMMKVDMPGPRLGAQIQPSIAGSPSPLNSIGLQVNSASIGTPTTPVVRSLPNLGAGGAPIDTTYFTGRDGIVARPFEPIFPKQIDNASVPNQVLRGVAFRGGTYTDHNGVYALTSSANTETSGPNQSFNSDVFYPNQTYSSNFYNAANGGTTNLISVPAQYRSTSPGSSDGTIRTFNDQQVNLYYLPSAWPSGSAAQRAAAVSPAPTITGVVADRTASSVDFKVTVTQEGSADVQSVWVVYTGEPGSPFYGRWLPIDLQRQVLSPVAAAAGFTPDPNLWVGSLPITANPGTIKFMVQAVNGAGLTTLSTNQGGYFSVVDTTVPPPPPAVASTLGIGGAPATVVFSKPATFTATLSATTGSVAGKFVLFNIGGQTAQAQTNGSGVASVTVVPVVPPGSYDVSATFRGDTATLASTATRSFAVVREATSTVISPSAASAVAGEDSGISAVVKDSLARPLSSKSVVFDVLNGNGASVKKVVVIADLYGVASLGALTLPAGSYTVQAFFSGGPIPIPDESYSGSSSASAALTLTAPVGPTITAAAKNADNSTYVADTWTKQNVTVRYTCSVANCPVDQVITTEGETVVGPVTVTAPNGLTASVTFGKVKIDRTAPTITITSPTAGASYALGSAVNAAFSCADTLSGAPGCVGTVANGQSLTATAGAKTFTVNATDGAGNTFTQTINYTVTGPVAAAPVVLVDYGVTGLQSIGFQTNAVFISGSFTDADGAAPYTASVRWTATGSFSNLVLNNNSKFLSAFIYPAAGTYTATVRICDNAGNCGTDDVTIRSGVTQKVTPRLNCVLDRGVGQNPRYQARFGYTNAAPVALSVLHIPLLENTFTASPFDRGQPQVFQPGTQSNVFTVNFNSGTISWRVNGTTVSASTSSPRC